METNQVVPTHNDPIIPLIHHLQRSYGINPITVCSDIPVRLQTTFNVFLHNHYVSLNRLQTRFVESPPECSYEDLLKYCRKLIVDKGDTENVLYAHQHGNNLLPLNQNDQNLRSVHWRVLLSIIGAENMMDLFLNCQCFVVNIDEGKVITQLFGDKLLEEKPFKFIKKSKTKTKSSITPSTTFSLNRCLFKFKATPDDPIPPSLPNFMNEIFPEDLFKLPQNTKLTKRFRKILQKVIVNHRSIRYFQILSEIVKEPKKVNDNLELALEKKEIFMFCKLVFEKVFPVEVYGNSNNNKSVILKSISKLVNLGKDKTLRLCDLIKGIKATQIKWVKEMANSNQPHSPFNLFINWLFAEFFPKLFTSFFYLTHISTSKQILFYQRPTWKRIVSQFESQYASTFLQRDEEKKDEAEADGKLRFLPKKNNDFRVINIPLRGGTEQEQLRYKYFLRDVAKPVQFIANDAIRHGKKKNEKEESNHEFVTLSSLSQIPTQLKAFKQRLQSRYLTTLPRVHYLQFDAKGCYDHLSQKKVEEILKKAVDAEASYVFNETKRFNLDTSKRKIKKSSWMLEDSIHQNNQTTKDSNNNNFYYRTGETSISTFSGSDILKLLTNQLYNSTTSHKHQIYTRAQGVFQGLNYSSVFNDILYDHLIVAKFQDFNNENSLVLRIADDFLVLCLDLHKLQRFKESVMKGYEEFGFHVNENKTRCSSNEAEEDYKEEMTIFCGYEIKLQNLNIIKRFDEETMYATQPNHSSVIKQLQAQFRMKIGYNTLDLELNSEETVIRQIEEITKWAIRSYVAMTSDLEVGQVKFVQFVKFAIDRVVARLDLNNRDNKPLNQKIERNVLTIIQRELSKKSSKFQSLIYAL